MLIIKLIIKPKIRDLTIIKKLTIFCSSFFFAFILLINPIYAAPQGGQVVAGSASIQQNNSSTIINQSSSKAIINWKSFNIGAQESTHFQQPQGGIALNRINPNQGASQIYGRLTATGKIILVNQAGIYFGPGAYVNVGGLIASTTDMSNQNFLSGNYIFDQPSSYNGAIVNKGQIIAKEHGLVALIGTSVSNEGLIQARMGNVVLASGNKFTVSLSGDQLINFTIDEGTNQAGVDAEGNKLKNGVNNSGKILSDGGRIIMTAKTAQNVVDHAINMSGVTQAKSVMQKNGVIILGANEGSVLVTGKINASGKNVGEKGGKIKVLGKRIVIAEKANIDATGYNGGGTILIGGNARGKGPEMNADYNYIGPETTMDASAIEKGNGGKVVVWSDLGTGFYGNIFARGGASGGNGGWVETSGKEFLTAQGKVIANAVNGKSGEWLLDPVDVTISAIDPSDGTSWVDVAVVNSTLSSGTDVTITTDDNVATQAGNILLKGAVGISNTASPNIPTLSLITNSAGDITIQAAISYSGTAQGLNVILSANGGNISQLSMINATSLKASNTGTGQITLNNINNNVANVALTSDTGLISFRNSVGFNIGVNGMGIQQGNNAGTLALLAGGAVTQSESILRGTSSGNITLTALAAGTDFLLNHSGNNFSGSIAFSGPANVRDVNIRNTSASADTPSLPATLTSLRNVTLNFDNNSISLPALTLTNGGNLSLTGTGIQQTGAWVVPGISSFSSPNSAITLTNSSNNFTGAITLSNSGNNAVSLTNSGTLNIAGATLGSGTLTLLGNPLSFSGGANSITGTGDVILGAPNLTTNISLTSANMAALSSSFNSVTVGPSGEAAAIFIPTLTFNSPTTLNTSLTINPSGTITMLGSNALTFNGPTILSGDTTVSASTGNINFQGTINNNSKLTLQTSGSGVITFNNTIGNTTPIYSLTVTGNTVINTGTINTRSTTINDGSQTYNGPITLNVPSTLFANWGDVTFNNTINGANALIVTSANRSANVIVFNGAVGGVTPLASLTAQVTSGVNFNSIQLKNAITTTGAQAYQTFVALSSGVNLRSINGAGISFANTVNQGSLTIANGSGNVVFSGSVGPGNKSLDSLTIGTNNPTSLSSVKADIQVYNSPITLTAEASPTFQGTSVTFNDKIDGAYNVIVNASLTANSPMGSITPFISLLTTGASVKLSGVTTTGTQNYSNINGLQLGGNFQGSSFTLQPLASPLNAVLTGNTSFTTTGDFTYATIISGTINGAYDLSINAGSISMRSNIGATTALTNLTLTAPSMSLTSTLAAGVRSLTVTTTGNQTYNGSVSTVGTTDNINLSGAAINFNGDLFTGSSPTINFNNSAASAITGTLTAGGLNNTPLTFTLQRPGSGSSSVLTVYQALIKNGNGTLTLSGNNGSSLTGSVSLSQGALAISADNQLGNGKPIIMNNGTLQATSGFNLGSDKIFIGTAMTIQVDSGTFGINSTIQNTNTAPNGNATITKTGAGILSLTSSIPYAYSNFNVNAGTLQINTGNLQLGVGTSPSSQVNLAGGSLDFNGTFNLPLNIALMAASSDIQVGSGSVVGITGTVSNSGNLNKTGIGTLSFSGANNYSGTTTVSAGTLSLGSTGALGNTSSVNVSAGNTLDANFSGTLANTIALNFDGGTGVGGVGTLTFSGTNSILSNNIAFASNSTIGGSGSGTLNGIVSGSGINLTKAGNGTINLGGANTYSGATNVNAGTLGISGVQGLGNTTGTTVASGGTLALGFNNATLSNINTITLNGTGVSSNGALVINGSNVVSTNPITLASDSSIGISGSGTLNTINGAFGLTFLGAGNLTLNNVIGGTTPLTSLITSSSGTTAIGANITTNGSQTYNNPTTSSTHITLSANGTGNINLNNTYTMSGTNNILTLSANAIGINAVLSNLNGTTSLTATGTGISQTAAIRTNHLAMNSVASINLNNVSNAINIIDSLAANGTVLINNNSALTINGAIGVGANDLTIDNTAGSTPSLLTIAANITGSTNISLKALGMTQNANTTINSGSGTLTLNSSTGTLTTNSNSLVLSTGTINLINNQIALNSASQIGGSAASTGTASAVNIAPATNGTTVGIGSTTGTLSLISSELNTIRGSTVRIGTSSNSLGLITLGAFTPNATFAPTALIFQNFTNGITQASGPFNVNSGAILAIKGTGNVNLTNVDPNIAVNLASGAFNLTDPSGNPVVVTSINDPDAGIISGVTAPGGVNIVASGALVLNQPITTSGTSHIILATSHFTNNVGASALVLGTGHYEVWSSNADPFNANPAIGDVRGGLAYNFKQYNATYGVTSVLGTGNGFLYTLAPVITPILTGTVNKVYDGTTATFGVNVNASGVVDNDVVVLNGPSSVLYNSKNVGTRTITASGISINNVTNGGATVYGYGLASNTANTLGDITPATLVASLDTGSTVSKVYNANTAATLTSGNYNSLSGIFSGDDVSLANFTSGNYDDKNVGSGKTVTVNSLTLSGADAGNYIVNSSVNANIGEITPATLVAGLIGSVDKVYDGTTSATLNSGNYSLSGVLADDTVNLNNPTSGFYDNKNVGSNKNIGVTGLNISGADSANYVVNTSANANIGTITPRGLIVEATGINKVYDATTNATVTLSNNGVSGDNLITGYTTASFANKNVGTAKPINVNGIMLSGTDAGNYDLLNTTAVTQANILPATLTTTGLKANNKVFDGNTIATLNFNNAQLVGIISGDDVYYERDSNSHFITSRVGNDIPVVINYMGLAGSDAANYTLDVPQNLTANILPRGVSPVVLEPNTVTHNVIDSIENVSNVIQQPYVTMQNDHLNKTTRLPLVEVTHIQSVFCFLSDSALGLWVSSEGCGKLKKLSSN